MDNSTVLSQILHGVDENMSGAIVDLKEYDHFFTFKFHSMGKALVLFQKHNEEHRFVIDDDIMYLNNQELADALGADIIVAEIR